MIVEPLAIPGAFRVLPEPRGDERGFFARLSCEAEMAAAGLAGAWAQVNTSLSRAEGTLRGLHYQRPPAAEVKMVKCLRGAILDVILDLRPGPGFGRHAMLRLDDETRAMAYIPEGCAHGFQTLTPDAELLYFHSVPYAPDHEGGVNPLDPALGIDWPRAVVQMSERDRALPPLSTTEPISP